MQETLTVIRRADPSEAGLLSDLAFRSKAVWGYDDAFMARCRAELTLAPDFVRQNPVFVVEAEGRIRGFYSLERRSADIVDLGHLFLEPADRGRGLGRRLVEHACEQACSLGGRRLRIEGDPNAEAFYAACGAKRIGAVPSGSIPGRELPLFEIELADRL